MKFKELIPYNCNVDRMYYITFVYVKDILENAVILNSFEEIFDHANMLVRTTGVTTLSDKRYIRRPIFTPKELREFLNGKSEKVANCI